VKAASEGIQVEERKAWVFMIVSLKNPVAQSCVIQESDLKQPKYHFITLRRQDPSTVTKDEQKV
jgi:hypothetical protein